MLIDSFNSYIVNHEEANFNGKPFKKYSRQAEIDNLIQNAVSHAVVRRYQFLNLENDLSTLSDEEVTRIIGGQIDILGSVTTVGRIPNNLF